MDNIEIRPLKTDEEVVACAEMMSGSEPWITLRRDYDASVRLLRDPEREVYVALDRTGVAGFMILVMAGAFTGYIQTVAVAPDRRGQGLGAQLMSFAEERIFEDSPNVFICVSSFNPKAKEFYERLGYRTVGELKEYIVPGHSEILMRKTLGPLREFSKKKK